MGTSRNADLDELLAHASWLRRLARQLVKRQMDVDDLTQETWTATLRRLPERGRPPRPWLAEVMRNLVRMRVRGERRRRVREAGAAGPERTGLTSEELVARMERQRQVAELVMALDEPYRSTILLRFYEEKSTREIAALQGVAVATVRWRLGEAVDRLRRELHRRIGGQSSEFLAALVPIASPWKFGELLQGVAFMAAAKTNAKLAVFALLGIALLPARRRGLLERSRTHHIGRDESRCWRRRKHHAQTRPDGSALPQDRRTTPHPRRCGIDTSIGH